MSKLSAKTILMSAIVFAATAIFNTGMPETALAWQIMGLTVAGTVLGYVAQSIAFPSTSIIGDLNTLDLVKAVLVGLSNVLSTVGASYVLGTAIDWPGIGKAVGMIVAGYIVKQLATPQPKSA